MKAQRLAVLPFLWPFESTGKHFRVAEGFEPFSNRFRKEGVTFAKPVFAYRLKYSNSITGGHVYRGDKNSSLYGVHVCADYTSRRLFGLTLENGVLKTARQIGNGSLRSARMKRASFTPLGTKARFTKSTSRKPASSDFNLLSRSLWRKGVRWPCPEK